MLSTVTSAEPSALVDALLALRPKYLSFGISFLVIASYWTSHQRIFSSIVRCDTRLVWLNVLLLLCIAFQPFPTSVLGTYGTTPAVTLYAGTLAFTGTVVLVMWLYATTGHRLVRADLDARLIPGTRHPACSKCGPGVFGVDRHCGRRTRPRRNSPGWQSPPSLCFSGGCIDERSALFAGDTDYPDGLRRSVACGWRNLVQAPGGALARASHNAFPCLCRACATGASCSPCTRRSSPNKPASAWRCSGASDRPTSPSSTLCAISRKRSEAKASGPRGRSTSSAQTTVSNGSAIHANDLERTPPRELLGTDLDGPDIARQLVVSLSTLRTHTQEHLQQARCEQPSRGGSPGRRTPM